MTTPIERLPRGPGWIRIRGEGPLNHDPTVVSWSAWQNGRACVVSALEMAELPDRSGVGPQWHVSISAGGKRPKQSDVRRMLRAFGMVGAEEDNHHPGNARHFWLPVDPAHRVDCECKADEQTIVEPDGYRWSNPHDPSKCRGCEISPLTGLSCALHSASRDAT